VISRRRWIVLDSSTMGLCVTFVSGPRRSGKSAVIQAMVGCVWKAHPHYIRLVRAGSGKQPPKPSAQATDSCAVASARWLEYDSERVFEILPEALTAIHKKDRYGHVVFEADTDPNLRYAYPWDHRIFVMPRPESVSEVFRDPTHAAKELRKVLDDTAAFASEVFGLLTQPPEEFAEPPEARADPSLTQMRRFLHSPLGDELATRIQLQPSYHGLVESDVVVVNSGTGAPKEEAEDCLKRLHHVLTRIRGVTGRKTELFVCDPQDADSSPFRKLLSHLRTVCDTKKK